MRRADQPPLPNILFLTLSPGFRPRAAACPPAGDLQNRSCAHRRDLAQASRARADRNGSHGAVRPKEQNVEFNLHALHGEGVSFLQGSIVDQQPMVLRQGVSSGQPLGARLRRRRNLHLEGMGLVARHDAQRLGLGESRRSEGRGEHGDGQELFHSAGLEGAANAKPRPGPIAANLHTALGSLR